jgi:hypothetical protein
MEEALDTLDGTDLDGAREYYYLREVVFDCAFNKKTKQLPSAGIMLYTVYMYKEGGAVEQYCQTCPS